MASRSIPSHTGNRTAIVIFLVSLAAWTLTNLDQSIFGYAIPGIISEFKVGLEVAGVILAISFVTSAFLVVVGGVMADRFGRAVALLTLLGGSAFLVGLQGFVGGIVMLTVLRALSFGLSGGLSAITNALVVENMPPRLRGLAIGFLQCGYPLGWFLASLLSAPLLESHGWRAICLIGFAVIPFAFLCYWLIRGANRPPVQRARAAEPVEKTKIADLFLPEYRRTSLACMVAFFCFGGAYAGSAFFFPSFFVETRGYTPAGAAGLIGTANGLAIVGYIAAALVGEFVTTRRNVFAIWIFAGALALLGLLWLPATQAQDLFWYTFMACFFYGASAVFPVLVAEIFPSHIRATALATCGSMPQCLGFAVFPMIVPAVVAWLGWKMALTVVVTPALIAAALVTLLLPNRPSGLPIAD